MRGFFRLVIVAAVAVPAGFLVAGPSGAAATTISCKAMTGTETFTPALPLKGSVPVTVGIKNGKLTGCTGAGGASGTLTLAEKTKGSCATLAKGGTVKGGTVTIAWANKTSSTISVTQVSPIKKNTLLASLNGTVTKGTLATKKLTFSVLYVIPAKFTGCTKTAVKSLPVKQGSTFSIK